ncbi:MAG: heavy-metal-associated domain-containing protein [Oscillospiraceae bacterium]|nr:heavy-metal-associated domain-containing protein [Oscillospiraceae bacterium]
MPEWTGTALVIVVIAAICAVAVISYVKKLSKGCCGTGADKEKRIMAQQGDMSYHYTVEVDGMSCEKCAIRVENGFNRQQGISARVDLKAGTAEIRSEKPLAELIIRKTIVELGYTTGRLTEHDR